MAKNTYNIAIKPDETILEFFQRCCDENGFNVSKLIKYIDYINDYIVLNLDENENGEHIVDMKMQKEIADFSMYFLQNYNDETLQKRIQTYGNNDAFVFQIFNDMVEISNQYQLEEAFNSLSKFEQRKFQRVFNQILEIDGDKSLLFLKTHPETREDLEPFCINLPKGLSKKEQKEVEDAIYFELLQMYIGEGVLICINDIANKDDSLKAKIFGVVYHNKEIYPIKAHQLLDTFTQLNDNFTPTLLSKYDKEDEVEFVDGSFYINPLGQSDMVLNGLGNKIPDKQGIILKPEKGRIKNKVSNKVSKDTIKDTKTSNDDEIDNIIPFSSLISRI